MRLAVWKLFRKPAPADPEVFEPPTVQGPEHLDNFARIELTSPSLMEREMRAERDERLAVLLAASCADASEPVDKFLQLYDRAQKYLEALDKRA